MTFIRVKKIQGKEYAYLVSNSWKQGGPKQSVKKYLGRIIRPQKKSHRPFIEYDPQFTDKPYPTIIHELISWEITRHSIQEEEIIHGKVFAINEGFLCNETILRIIKFRVLSNESQEQTAIRLAKYFVEAGVEIPQEVFICVYQKIVPV
jgi:hypothetical protein